MRNGRPSPIRAWPCIHYFSHAATKWEVSKCLPQSRSSFLDSEQNHQIGISISDCVLSLSHSAEQRLCLHILQSLFVSVISSSPAAPIWSSTVYSPLNIWSFLCYFRRQNARFSQIVQKKKKFRYWNISLSSSSFWEHMSPLHLQNGNVRLAPVTL